MQDKENNQALIERATFVGFIADETTDVSNIGQMVVRLRCVASGTIRTVFGGLVSVTA